MLLRPKTRSNYAKWFGSGKTLNVLLEFRPRLDKWDVISLEKKFQELPRWYMHQKTERFATMLEAIKFILKLSNEDELSLQDRYTNEVQVYNLEEIEMTNKPVENITLIYGKDSRFVTDDAIFEYIKNIEDEIRRLNNINNQPVKLKKKIESLKESVQDLVKVVDNR